ncbi:MAG TPA: FxsA family protein, partial [Solirubrobacteraceae bacterium]
MLLPLVLLFVVVPLAELFVIIQVGQAIGVWWTIGILIADSILGSVLMRSQGRSAWRRFNDAVRGGRVPAREVVDGALVIFGGALLLTPGFLTDILGLVLLLPPTRAVVRAVLLRRFAHRLVASATA